MAGFLDPTTRVLDMVLTNQGKALLSKGQLHFCYWIPFDDEVVYTPYISLSGTLTAAQLSASNDVNIESTPIREATTGYQTWNMNGQDNTNVNNPMFTMAQGQENIPQAVLPSTSSQEIVTSQRKVVKVFRDRDEKGKFLKPTPPVDVGLERYDSTAFTLELSYTKDSFAPDFAPDGFRVQVFKSGSGGMVELFPKNDMQNDLCYGSDVRVYTGKR